jgi:hypothetical protein
MNLGGIKVVWVGMQWWQQPACMSHVTSHDKLLLVAQVSSVELERAVVEGVEGVVEAAAVAASPAGGGPSQLHLYLVLREAPACMPGPHETLASIARTVPAMWVGGHVGWWPGGGLRGGSCRPVVCTAACSARVSGHPLRPVMSQVRDESSQRLRRAPRAP